jgi:hypothetical protein
MSYLLKKKMKMVQVLELHAIGEIAGSYKIGAQRVTNPNPASRAFPHAAPITEPGVKVEAIFQMTSVLRAGSMVLAAWSNPLQG